MTSGNQNPGPGDYDPKDFKSKHNPSWKLAKDEGQSKREIPIEQTPGPGEYSLPDKFDRKEEKKKKTQNKTQDLRKNNSKAIIQPGPGQYEIQTAKSNIAYTMGSRHPSEKTMETSASIGTDQFIKKQISISFGKSKRDALNRYSDVPGPGAYSTPNNLKGNLVKSHNGFGTSSRGRFLSKDQELTPGPGNYEISNSVGKSNAGFSIKSKYKDLNSKLKQLIPGPGQYNTQSDNAIHKKSPS